MEIRPIPFGQGNGYVLRNEGRVIIVDTGPKGKYKKIKRSLAQMGHDCTEISLVVLTHTHYDHTGNLAACKRMSGAPVAVHAAEAQMLRDGYSTIPSGATPGGRFIVSLVRRLGLGGASFEPVEPEIVLGAPGAAGVSVAAASEPTDSFDLHEHGFPGEAIHTPSHSPGSISLLCDDGSCFPGDILFNIFPGTVMPPFADNPELLASHWRLLLDRGAKTFYPGHGRPFGRDRLESALEKKGEGLGRGG